MQLTLFNTLREEVQAMPNGIVARDYQQQAIDKAYKSAPERKEN